MIKTILIVVLLLVLVAGCAYVWINYGPQLAQLPGQITGRVVAILKGMVGGLASFGSTVADSFKSVVP